MGLRHSFVLWVTLVLFLVWQLNIAAVKKKKGVLLSTVKASINVFFETDLAPRHQKCLSPLPFSSDGLGYFRIKVSSDQISPPTFGIAGSADYILWTIPCQKALLVADRYSTHVINFTRATNAHIYSNALVLSLSLSPKDLMLLVDTPFLSHWPASGLQLTIPSQCSLSGWSAAPASLVINGFRPSLSLVSTFWICGSSVNTVIVVSHSKASSW